MAELRKPLDMILKTLEHFKTQTKEGSSSTLYFLPKWSHSHLRVQLFYIHNPQMLVYSPNLFIELLTYILKPPLYSLHLGVSQVP